MVSADVEVEKGDLTIVTPAALEMVLAVVLSQLAIFCSCLDELTMVVPLILKLEQSVVLTESTFAPGLNIKPLSSCCGVICILPDPVVSENKTL